MEVIENMDIKITESRVQIHKFTATIVETVVNFEVIKFKDSLFIWIGNKRNRIFNDLSLALLPHDKKEALCTKILGHTADLTSNNIANKLSKKLNKPVYVSFNLVSDRFTVPLVNERIAEELRRHPEFF